MEKATCVEVRVDGRVFVLSIYESHLCRREVGDLITAQIAEVRKDDSTVDGYSDVYHSKERD